MQRIETMAHITQGLDALVALDPRLGMVRERAGDVPLRLSEPGFHSLASILISQQVSRASADAIFGRLTAMLDPLTPQSVLEADEAVFRTAGLSRPKQRSILAAATAVADGLDLAGHPDIFPARDVALQTAVGHALTIDPRPGEKPLLRLAESWRPWRGVAARLFWAYYRELKGREAAPPA
jgi:DNA-3-methyladenine glycosylase II